MGDSAGGNLVAAVSMMAEDFHRLSPTLIITGELDLLRDEGEDYAKKLPKAGVTTVCAESEMEFTVFSC